MGKKRSFPAVRSDIPYVQRKQMEKYATIAAHRDEAAAVALQVACVALNDTEGLATSGFPASPGGSRCLSTNTTQSRRSAQPT